MEWALLVAVIVVAPVVFLWFASLVDVVRRRDLSNVRKTLWLFILLLLPLISTAFYVLARPTVILPRRHHVSSSKKSKAEGPPAPTSTAAVDTNAFES
jgi:hypothetical protein